jgi:hypothetical protein
MILELIDFNSVLTQMSLRSAPKNNKAPTIPITGKLRA